MDKIISKITDNFFVFGIIDRQDLAIYRYGLEMLFLSSLEIISVLSLAFIVGNFLETVIYFIAFIPIRIFAGGYHASTRLNCYFLSLFMYGIFTLLLKSILEEYQLIFSVSIAIISLLIIFLFAPIIHSNRYCEEVERAFYKKISRKIALVEIIMVFMCCFFDIKVLALIIALGLFSEILTLLAARILIYNKLFI